MDRLLSLIGLILFCANGLVAQTDGIFADFKTSFGSFTCRLDYAVAPKAVANFIGLATGQKAWLDLNTGLVRTNSFYNGLIFHRVIQGFMNQSGSPNGQGTDGPGYAFIDEFSAASRHDAAGVLSLANSGPDSNGSQFFVTAAATPWLDGVHTILGRVVGGLDVVLSINGVPTVNDRPKTNIVVETVTIRRVGVASQAFNIHAQGLPAVTHPTLTATAQGTNVNLLFGRAAYVDSRLYSSTNLTTWSAKPLGITLDASVPGGISTPATNRGEFFRVAQIQYAGSTFAPPDVSGRTLTILFANELGTITTQFDATNGGSYTYTKGASGTITRYAWTQEPYAGRLWPIEYSNLVAMTLRLNFDNASSGTVSGTAYTANPFSVSGTFVITTH
ncbi:MAG: peptidylprolyl isomerase [Pedosphaera sp.]|nr:peptidylprolyl isomerase [Pedosphaera sp.]